MFEARLIQGMYVNGMDVLLVLVCPASFHILFCNDLSYSLLKFFFYDFHPSFIFIWFSFHFLQVLCSRR